MTVSSTKTFLEVANEVLLMAGERPTTSLTSNPVARKVASVLKESVLEIALLDDWAFTRERINALSWVGGKADLGDVQRIVGVNYGKHPVLYLDPIDFDIRIGVGAPVWTVDGYGSVRVSPEPLTGEDQLKYTFEVIKALVTPEDDNDTFPLPDRLMPLVTKRSLYLFVLRHLDDASLAAQYNNEFEMMVQLLRNRERYRPRGAANMYRGRRR